MKQIIGIILSLLTINLLSADSTEQPYQGWLQTETEHFTIIYEEISRESVIELTDFCEDIYKRVTSFFDSYPKKITVVIRDRIDLSNGSYNPVPPHINIYTTTPGTPELGAGVDNWLRFVLTHELVHYVNMNMEEGLFYNLSRVLGKSAASVPGGLLPGWAIEGIAVKLETDLTDAGRGNNPFFEMFSRALILEDKMFSFRQAAYSSLHPPASRIYIAGYLLNDYMALTYGDDIFVRVYREFLKFPFPGFNYYVKKVTGDSISKIFTDMEKKLEEKYSGSASEGGMLIFPDVESNYFLPVITDAGWICYRESVGKESGIVIIDPKTKEEKVLVKTRLTDYSSLSASKDGNLIVFAALRINNNTPSGLTAGSELYIYNRSTDRLRQITFNSRLRQPAISPDGTELVAVQIDGHNTKLVRVDISTGKTENLDIDKDKVFNPFFSGDGKNIAFSAIEDGNRAIWVISNTGTISAITSKFPGNDYKPIFTNYNTLIFVSDISGNPELYEFDPESPEILKKIVSDPVGVFSGLVNKNRIIYSTWSPNGYTLRETPYRVIVPAPPQDLKQELYDSQKPDLRSVEQTEKTLVFRKYTDTPRLIAAIPLPFHIDPLYDSKQLFGPGFSSYFQSILGKNIIDITATLNTSTMQPGISFNYIYDWGPVSLDYTLLQGYAPTELTGLAYQTTSQKVLLNFPLVSNKNIGISTYLGLFTGVVNSFSIVSAMDFTFLNPPGDENSRYINSVYQINGFGFSLERNKSVRDIIPPWKLVSSAMIYTPVNENFLNLFALKITASINLPSIVKHHIIRVSGRFAYSGIEELKYFNTPRGFPNDSPDTGGIIPAIDYLFTIAVPDLPILGGLSLQGIAGAIHMEKIFSIEKSSILPNDNIYGGIELLFLGNYINIFETAGIGISYKFTPYNTEFNTSNIGIYIFAGTNSFTGSGS